MIVLCVGVVVGFALVQQTQPGWWERLWYPLRYEQIVRGHARNYSLDPALLAAVIYQESKFKADARSTSGAIGLMQLLPDTAKGIAVHTGRQPLPRRRPLRPRDQRPLRRVVPPPPAGEVRRRADGARGVQRRPGQRRPLASRRPRHPVRGDARVREPGRGAEGDLPARVRGRASTPGTAPSRARVLRLVRLLGRARRSRPAASRCTPGRAERPREQPSEPRRQDLGGREPRGRPGPAAAAAGDELADRLRESPVWTGCSSPSCASPSTNGSRRKLVTSSCASVRAALNVAAESTTRSSEVRRGVAVEEARAPAGHPEPADEDADDRRVRLVRQPLRVDR